MISAAKNETGRPSWLQLIAFLYRINGAHLFLLIPLELIQSLIPVGTVYLTALLVDALAGGGGARAALLPLVLQGALLAVGQITSELSGWLRTWMQTKVEFQLMERLYQKLAEIPHSQIEQPHFQDLLRRARNSIPQMGTGFFESILQGGRSIITLIGYLVILGGVHWLLPTGMVALGLVSVLLMARTGVRNQAQWVEHNKWARHIDYIWNLPTVPHINREVKLFGLWSFIHDQWERLWTRVQKERLDLSLRNDLTTVAANVIAMVGVFGIYLYLVWGVTESAVTVGGFVALSGAATAAMGQLQALSQTLGQGVERWLRSVDALDFLAMRFPTEGEEGLRPIQLATGLHCEALSYTYPRSDRPSIRNLSLQVRPGERVMIVGENGSGKSTLIKLLTGLYPPDSGELRYEGDLIGAANVRAYQSRLGVLFQEFGQYDMTGYENLALGQIDRIADRPTLEAVARRAKADRFLAELPEGYETVLGHWLGKPLSFGQWQRIALARVMLRNAEILLLDEPASALDPAAQAEIFDQLLAPDAKRIRLFVSHDLDCHRWADRIIVIKEGALIEEGTHEALLRAGGEYARLYQVQGAGQAESLSLAAVGGAS